MKSTRLAGTCLLALCLAACGSTPSRPKPAPLPALPSAALETHRDWSATAGSPAGEDASRLRPAVVEGRLILAGGQGRLRALDAGGATLWERRTGLPLSGGLSAAYGRILAGTREGDIAAFAVADGAALWTRRLSAALLAPAVQTADRVVAQTLDGRVHVLDAASGEPVWSQEVSLPEVSLRGYAPPVVAGDLVIAASANGKITALDLATGAGRWEVQVVVPKGRTDVERLADIDGDMLLTFDEKLYVASYQGNLVALDLRDRPEPLWETPVSTLQGPAEGLGNVYVAAADGRLLAVDAASGKEVWSHELLKGRELSAPVVIGGRLAVGDQAGYVHFFAQADGAVLGRRHVRGAVRHLSPWGDRLIVMTGQGVRILSFPQP